jgi:regulator of sirC expression with transglutaminase-like and TPR domain
MASIEGAETYLRVLASNTLPIASVLSVERLSLAHARALLGAKVVGVADEITDDGPMDEPDEAESVEEPEEQAPEEDAVPADPEDPSRYFRYATPAPAAERAAPPRPPVAETSYVDFDGPPDLNADEEAEEPVSGGAFGDEVVTTVADAAEIARLHQQTAPTPVPATRAATVPPNPPRASAPDGGARAIPPAPVRTPVAPPRAPTPPPALPPPTPVPAARSQPPATARVLVGSAPETVDVEAFDEEEPEQGEPNLVPSSSTPTMGPRTPAPAAQRTPAASGRVTAGLYGDPAVPRIRDGAEARPRAAAIQIDPDKGVGRVVGAPEEEAIEIGDLGDYGEEEVDDGGSGEFRLDVQEYETQAAEAVEEPEPEQVEEVEEPVEEEPPSSMDRGAAAKALHVARHAVESGDMATASQIYSDLIDMDPGNVDAHIGRGRLYLDLGDFSRSMSDFLAAEDLAPGSPEPQIAVGDLYFARKDYRKAISYFDAALEMSPMHAMALCRRGISHYYRKNHGAALADLTRAVQLDPEIPNIQSYLSMARKRSGR